MKKAGAEMWWIIIGAVIALVVLIILMVIFTGKSGKLETGLLDCKSKGGRCDLNDYQCTQDYKGTVSKAFDCEGQTEICCFTSKKDILS